MKYFVIKEFLDYKEGDIVEIEVNYIEDVCVIFEDGAAWNTFSTYDLDIYFMAVAEWRQLQINSILE